MSTFKLDIQITNGARFIGSHVVRLFINKYPEYPIINLDKLTYAGNLTNLKDIGQGEEPFVKTTKYNPHSPYSAARRAATISCGPSMIRTAYRP